MSTNRDVTLHPLPLLTSFPRSTAGFPWCSVSEGAQLFFYIQRLVHFLVPGLAGESLSVSDFNLAGWTLEATCWSDSQVTAPSQGGEEHTWSPGESYLSFGIWSCFDEAMNFELQASVKRNVRQKRALGFLRKCFSTTSHFH